MRGGWGSCCGAASGGVPRSCGSARARAARRPGRCSSARARAAEASEQLEASGNPLASDSRLASAARNMHAAHAVVCRLSLVARGVPPTYLRATPATPA
eukprot:scaffold28681_cov129-Isochrysis_galbana.AAC.4